MATHAAASSLLQWLLRALQEDKLTKGAALLCRVTCSPPKRPRSTSAAGNVPAQMLSSANDGTAVMHADLCAYPEYVLCYNGKAMQ